MRPARTPVGELGDPGRNIGVLRRLGGRVDEPVHERPAVEHHLHRGTGPRRLDPRGDRIGLKPPNQLRDVLASRGGAASTDGCPAGAHAPGSSRDPRRRRRRIHSIRESRARAASPSLQDLFLAHYGAEDYSHRSVVRTRAPGGHGRRVPGLAYAWIAAADSRCVGPAGGHPSTAGGGGQRPLGNAAQSSGHQSPGDARDTRGDCSRSGIVLAFTAASILLAGSLAGEVSIGGAIWLALALCIAALAFATFAALAGTGSGKQARGCCARGAVFAAALIVRVAAGGSRSLGWLRWLTPLGWIEEMRPLTRAQRVALAPIIVWIAVSTRVVLLGSSFRVLAARVAGRPRRLVARPCPARLHAGLHLEGGRRGRAGVGGATRADRDRVASAYRHCHRRGVPRARVRFARGEEASGRVDTLLSAPIGRDAGSPGGSLPQPPAASPWPSSWRSRAAQARRSNTAACLSQRCSRPRSQPPVVASFLGLGVLALALVPRHRRGRVRRGRRRFSREQTGAIVKAPEWTLAIFPFHWLALVPSLPFDVVA